MSFAKDVSDDVYAEIVDPAFRDVTDPFARKDKVTELQPKIAAYKESVVGKSPNVTVIVDQSIKLSPYNMKTGTYQVSYKVDGAGSSIEWSRQAYDMGALEFGVTLAAGLMKKGKDEYAEVSFKVDEATARAIESQVASLRGSATSWVSLPYRGKVMY